MVKASPVMLRPRVETVSSGAWSFGHSMRRIRVEFTTAYDTRVHREVIVLVYASVLQQMSPCQQASAYILSHLLFV